MKYLIIGGVAGGATVAARLKRINEQAEITLYERGNYVSYANCGLPYYIGGTIKDREKLFVQTVKGFTERFDINIKTGHEVTAIHPDRKEVVVKELASGNVFTEKYDKLVLSPGAAPLRPGIEGIQDDRIKTLRNIPDTDEIKAMANPAINKKAVVVGGGFIGLEMAENLLEAGLEVDVVEMANQVMAPLDYSMAAIVHQHLTEKGIRLHLENGVNKFESTENGLIVHLKNGEKLETDLVILSIGVRPETRLAREAGLTIGQLGGIAVNEYLQTSDPDIYALGDAIEVNHLVTNQPALIPLAGPANKQGRIVADNITFGNKKCYKGSIGTSIAKIFDLTVAAAGANSKVLRKVNIPYQTTYIHSSSHAGYYPNSVPLSLKILFSPQDGRLLGAQIVGYEGVDKRIEMLAQTIQHQGSIYDLAELEHAYAPPYSSAKDPVNMAGFTAENILHDHIKTIHWRDIAELSEDTLRIDVRTADEYKLGSIPGFINIPTDDLRSRLHTINKNQPIVVTCAVGLRGYIAARILMQNGFTNVRNLSGGYKTWKIATAPIVNPEGKGKNMSNENNIDCCTIETEPLQVDACGLMCPGPVMKLKQNYENMHAGELLQIKATDQAFGKDVASWCKMTGAELVQVENKAGIVTATIRKQSANSSSPVIKDKGDNKTLIVFSDDLDKALASFVIANGAASTGKKVTMFFTFWGLNVIKKQHKPEVRKDLFGKMFGFMLPSNSKGLKLSKMNMGGIGSRMMRHIMKDKRIDSLEYMISQAVSNGVEMIACTMSMDVMGVQKEELLDNVTLGGVASYLERAEQANLNLFI